MDAWQRAKAVLLFLLAAHGCTDHAADGGGRAAPVDATEAPPAAPAGSPGRVPRAAPALAHGLTATRRASGARPTHKPYQTSDVAPLPQVSPPQIVGLLAGPRASVDPAGVRFYGTDMGLTVEHRGELFQLFGDTWADTYSVCNPNPGNDDVTGVLPLQFDGTVPRIRFLTEADSPRTLRNTTVFRGADSLPLGFGRAPVAGFSDGERMFALIQRLDPLRCDAPWATGDQACATGDQFSCGEQLGFCEPAMFPLPAVCDATKPDSCLPDQTCVAAPLCVDRTASQYRDGSFEGRASSVAYTVEISAARSGEPTAYDSVLTFPTNKFSMPATRTVTHFTGQKDGSDYAPGHGTLLYWGRSGFLAENGRESHLYLMAHQLPLELDSAGKLIFEPQYFAGTDSNGEPTWSALQSEAAPIALDGRVGGSPHEILPMVGMYNISWLPAPINKWVMLYGGDLADYLMLNAEGSRASREPGSISIRFADHPWGPFSPPVPHLRAGDPKRPHDAYGPGGILYHPDCVDTAELDCARSDPRRPPDSALTGCPSTIPDPGRLYQPNIIDSYTRPNDEGGLDMIWNVSTWNPYAVQLVKTRIFPPERILSEPAIELATQRALDRMASWTALPELGPLRRYQQQSSRDRGTGADYRIPLSYRGNRDYNNFVCAGRSTPISNRGQLAEFHFDEPVCAEDYVRGAVLARFEGSGHLARSWLAARSLVYGPADEEVLRIYVDDDPRPRIEVPLAEALDGRAGEIFAPPFGAGTPMRLSWYYPVAFHRKLIIALDGLDDSDIYQHHSDAVLEAPAQFEPLPEQRLSARDAAARQLSDRYHPGGLHGLVHEPVRLELEPGGTRAVRLEGPATIYELRIRTSELALQRLAAVQVRISWDDRAEPAISLPLLDLLGGSVPPDHTSLAITSYLEGDDRVLGLKLPMPFERAADISFHNAGRSAAAFELRLIGERKVPAREFGTLHAQLRETLGPTDAPLHAAAIATGRGRLVGVCGQLEGRAEPSAGQYSDNLNFLEGDVKALIDGALALDGTGTEEYADGSLYYLTSPTISGFAQTWGVQNGTRPPGRASFCRWHVLGTELEFGKTLQLTFELGGQMNPSIVDRYRTVAYLYLRDPS